MAFPSASQGLFAPLDKTEKLEGLRLGVSLPSWCLRLRGCHLPRWLAFVTENKQAGRISHGYFSSPASQNQGDFAPVFTVRTWWGSLEVKPKKVLGPLRLGPYEFLILKLVHTQPPDFISVII